MKLLTAARMRKAEIKADADGTGPAVLMENAGRAAAKFIADHTASGLAVIVCGNGNNGGDGFVCAVYLKNAGYDCSLIMAGGLPATSVARMAFDRCEAEMISATDFFDDNDSAVDLISRADVLVDAVFGIGFSGDLGEDEAGLLGMMNSSRAVKFAMDIPSGCRADDGTADRSAFYADYTLAFGAYKPAHFIWPAASHCGETELFDIGICSEIIAAFDGIELADEAWIKARFPVRDKYCNKGDFGRALVVAGQPGMAGAAKLAARGASAAGAGITELFTDRRIAGAISAELTVQLINMYSTDCRDPIGYGAIGESERERICAAADKATAAVFGCGWGNGSDRADVIFAVADSSAAPIIIDADGLNSISGYAELLGQYEERFIITPHPGELSRLMRRSVSDICENRLSSAVEFAEKNHLTLLLKGADTIVTDGERVCIITAGSPGMAKGGSGDLLAGVICGFCAQGIDTFDAAVLGAWCCGMAGELAAKRFSVTACNALDTLSCLSDVFLMLE